MEHIKDISSSFEKEVKDWKEYNDAYSSPGVPEMIWSSCNKYNPSYDRIYIKIGLQRIKERGNLWEQYSRARTSKLFERDCVWAVTQTVVSLSTLWVRLFLSRNYRVYPGFWGRNQSSARCSTLGQRRLLIRPSLAGVIKDGIDT